MKRSLAVLLALALAAGCGRTYLEADEADAGSPADAAPPAVPARTTLTRPRPLQRRRRVTLSTDRPATLLFTTDGSNPRTSPRRAPCPRRSR